MTNIHQAQAPNIPNTNRGEYKRVVVKAGTSVLTKDGANGLDEVVLSNLVVQISQLKQTCGGELLLVTSGAITAGRGVLDRRAKAKLERDIVSRQVLAAIGQGQLMRTYQDAFAQHDIKIAQTLLTTNDLSNRQSYLNVRNTLLALLELGVVPIINENDVVA